LVPRAEFVAPRLLTLKGRDTMSQVSHAIARRPGLVTFASIMLFVFAGFQFTWALIEFFQGAGIAAYTYGTFGGYLFLWGILDALFGVVAFYAGVDVFRGGTFGQVAGLVIASVSAIRWFFYLPAMPWMAVVIIAVDVLVIYALVAHSDYFRTTR
jgi:hypothetical protein